MTARLRSFLPSILLALAAACGDDTQTPPPPPPHFPAVADLSAGDVTATSVLLRWTTPDTTATKTGVTYDLRSSVDPALPWDDWTRRSTTAPAPAPGSTDSLRVDGLESGEILAFRLRWGVDGRGWSAVSNTAYVRPREATGRTWTVRADGSGDVATLQDAVASASSGDLVLVEPGRYAWSTMVDLADTVAAKRGMIYVRRGLANLEIRSTHGAAVTVLDGEGLGRLVWFEGYNDGGVLDGFTITDGVANEFSLYRGGGVIGHLNSVTIRNCVLEGNRADGTRDVPGKGGALYWGGVGALRLEGCVIRNNTADLGGGALLVNSNLESVFERCVLQFNRAREDGGGLFVYNANATAESCVFVDNVAEGGGGAAYLHGGPVTSPDDLAAFRSCTLAGNAAPSGSAFAVTDLDRFELLRSIVSHGRLGPPMRRDGTGDYVVDCSDVFGNAGGDLLPPGAQAGGGVISVDPLYCGWATGDAPEGLMLQEDSPCVDGDGCDRMGALPPGCAR